MILNKNKKIFDILKYFIIISIINITIINIKIIYYIYYLFYTQFTFKNLNFY